MRSYLPGIEDQVKVFILEQFTSPGDRISVGGLYNKILKTYDITPGRFFRILSDLERNRYIGHETVENGEWTVSVLRRL